jgi:hypothetical protein
MFGNIICIIVMRRGEEEYLVNDPKLAGRRVLCVGFSASSTPFRIGHRSQALTAIPVRCERQIQGHLCVNEHSKYVYDSTDI